MVIGQSELGERFTERLDEVKDTIQLKGFRRGKVPAGHIKKLYGRSLMAEVLQTAVEETSRKALTDRKERPAFQPKIELPEDKDEIERVMSGRPTSPTRCRSRCCRRSQLADLGELKLERLVADVPRRGDRQGARRAGQAQRRATSPRRAARPPTAIR